MTKALWAPTPTPTHTHTHTLIYLHTPLIHTYMYMYTHVHTLTHSRVHISEATLKFVGDDFEVEPGNGQERDSYLKEKGIRTFLIVENIEVVCVHVTCDFVCVHV